MFVLFLVIALITQLSLGAEVAHQATSNRANHLRMTLACRSTAEEILTLIKDDASGEPSSGFSSALSGPGAFPGMEGMGAAGGLGQDQGQDVGAEGEEGDGEEGEGEEDASNSDSFEDGWARPMRVVVDDIEITTFVSDENGKFNLHLLLVEDELAAEENFERAVRILGAMRNDFDDDLGESDARIILDELLRWMQVDSRNEELPLMPRHSLDEDSKYTMLSALEEMMLLESVSQELFYDQVRPNELIAPGLESIFTIWTVPAFEAAGVNTLDSDGAAGSAADGSLSADGSAGQEPTEDAGDTGDTGDADASDSLNSDRDVQGEGGMEGALDGDPPIGTLININTAPRAVIEGMFPSVELTPVKVTALLEYRNEVDEDALEERDNAEEEPEDKELRESIYGEYEPEPRQFFRSLEQVTEVEGFDTEDLEEETQAEIQALLGVQSDIFSVYVIANRKLDPEWEPSRRYQEAPGKAMRLKAVVWRRTTQDGVKLIYLEPWHEVPYSRWRIPDFQRDQPPFEPPSYR
ncbi:MAG: type II secretion system protein GspK [Planctomycetota bacterium]|nr:type II secretion system protein GspK [Planctomycetota bacterium]